ncbi:MAG TPA: DNA-processing protein DprA [Bacteroidales bacterium]|nr:DNA-processing protein DprA [Bacteroidales bacterium]
MDEQLRYLIALSMVPSVGAITARKLISYSGSARDVFKLSREKLKRIPGIGDILSTRTGTPGLLEKADREIEFCHRHSISISAFYDEDFPARVKQCPDAPLVLFYRGFNILNATKVISIVGTRRATEYGTSQCQKLIRELSERHPGMVIVSGLAYGIDYQAHTAALKYGLKTAAVMGHGLHTVYPYEHKNLAFKIIEEQGCLVSDFTSGMQPEPNNFIKRNRIIAGLADATIVVESAMKGGALITADIAASYNRDVFAYPGRAGDELSAGCNQMIKMNKAALIEACRDVEYFLGWDSAGNASRPRQGLLFAELSEEEELVVGELKKSDKLNIDDLGIRLGWPVRKLSPLLLNLEFEGLITPLPGNFYKLNK